MDPQIRDIVQNVLTSSCAPHTRTDGGYFGQTPPDNTIQFRARLFDNVSSFKFNSWLLDSVDKITVIDLGDLAYKNTYATWVAMPLSGDAPQAVQDWQAEARRTNI